MKISKHTRGPWRHKVAGANYWIMAEYDRYIAYIGGADGVFTTHPNTPHEANARLIAAAPDLLEACKLVFQNLEPLYSSEHLCIKMLRTAIAKAESEG